MGTAPFAFPSLEKLMEKGFPVRGVITRPDQPAGRGKKLLPPPMKDKANSYPLDVWQPKTRDELLELLNELCPEVLVNVAFGMILSRGVLELPPWGCINLHPSLLPAYRGAAPIQRAIMAGERVTGITVLYMSAKLDAGDIILQEKTHLGEKETCGSLSARLAEMGAEALVKALELVEKGEVSPRPQQEAMASYAPPLTKEEEKLDWHRKAIDLHNQVRALNPKPGAYAHLGRKRLKIWEAAPLEGQAGAGEVLPGTVCHIEKQCFDIQAGEGKLRILKLQPEGKKSMGAGEFLAGYQLQAGDRFE